MDTLTEEPQLGHLISISDREYRLLVELIYQRFGINLGEQKRSLVVGRLNKVLRKLGFDSFKDYYSYLVADKTSGALNTLINRISTNHTFFYRESDHFEFFKETVLPEMIAALKNKNRRDLRIWCPGCSSGEEPYMLAMIINEYFGQRLGFWEPKILATDISERVLKTAKAGIYVNENVSHLPPPYRNEYFTKLPDKTWAISEKVKEMILFRRLNLMRDSYPFKSKFHVIFCRNVMIYFDKTTRDALVHRFSDYMEGSGYLFIGHSESLGRDNTHFRYLRPAVYHRNQ
jgi:chemotaxis protein methyltransferase CheR